MSETFASAAARLAAVLTDENAALVALDLPRAAALLPVKTRAADAFMAACADGSGAVRVAAGPLAGLAAENRRLLRHAIVVQGRVIELVCRALPRALQQASPRYGAQGRTETARPPAVAVSARA